MFNSKQIQKIVLKSSKTKHIFFLFLFIFNLNSIFCHYTNWRKLINKGNCFLIDNQLNNSFNLNKLSKNIELDVSFPTKNNINETEKILINICENKISKKTQSENLLKIIKNDKQHEFWYNYTYDSKFWVYDPKKQELHIQWNTQKSCGYTEDYFDNEYYYDNDIDTNIENKTNNYNKSKFYFGEDLKMSILLNITCNRNQEEIKNFDDNFYLQKFLYDNKCLKTLHFESKYACPNESELYLFKFYCEYAFIFGLVYILAGIFILLYGNFFESVTYYFIGVIFTRILILFGEEYLISFLKKKNGEDFKLNWVLWTAELLGIIIGIFLGKLIKKYKILKTFLLGSMTGHYIFYFVWWPLFNIIHKNTELYYMIFNTVCFLITGYFANIFLSKSHKFLIFSSGIIGSYNTIKV